MHTIDQYRDLFSDYLSKQTLLKEPLGLYEPVDYIIGIGGKRMRPVLTLMGAEIFDASYKEALPAALAVEMFHNFSLVHDDIMDDAPLRRGNETVHEKWNLNTGILSGDAMLILAYRYFEQYEPETFRDLAKLFSKTALEVCEGQQWDVDFETRDDVTIPEYLKMIEYKTAVLVGAALKMGAIVAKASENDQNLIYDFGRNLGIAFQLQDDYLDAFGDPATFGKQVGGDIIENKKTYLYLKALAFADEKEQLQHLYSISPNDNTDKIDSVKRIFDDSGASEATREAIREYTFKAFGTLAKLTISEDKKFILRNFGENLMNRNV
ncbi:polyprenyl synthetase family protein [Flavobacterium sp. MAH-1]|uniref:Polyprenyl synthetase family protein n=1 Tax=Flavobacterium agri TaxID=2743471 RepID=A0A7Y8Y103_9FLAO|nr:polyprenyl synthetase family protein [Flavobacterium agri]NUY80410.1 polyprenyl synthetase family protein [Flavobacterium agri]NYA70435.1 polyprenyl synthetase family protein [Flavobacterium agri]